MAAEAARRGCCCAFLSRSRRIVRAAGSVLLGGLRWMTASRSRMSVVGDERQAARDLARFVSRAAQVPAAGAPRTGRAPLRELDDGDAHGHRSAGDVIDRHAALAAWERALTAPAWTELHVDTHRLAAAKSLVTDRRLSAVIDFGGSAQATPPPT